jgi:hypothetical protein
MSETITPKIAHLPDYSPDSRVWVYVCDRNLSDEEANTVQQELDAFCRNWTAHNQALLATAEVFENQFVFLMVDETRAGASGCSIDKSVHFLENLGDALTVDFFERMRFAWVGDNGRLTFGNQQELATAVKNRQITDTTLMANTLAQSKRDLVEKWLQPFNKSWHRRIAPAN